MIYIENLVYTQVREAVLDLYEDAYVTGSYTPKLEHFPCVMIQLTDSSVVERGIDSNKIDNWQRVIFTIEVFTDNRSQKKENAKVLFNCVDQTMTQLGFVRTFYSPTPNVDETIQRITGRYKGVATYDESTDKTRVYPQEI